MPSNLLEPEFAEPYAAWKASPSPETTRAMLDTIQPTVDRAIKLHVGSSSPLLVSRARGMALEGLRRYDPSRSRLQTHLVNHLQGLKRVNRQQTTILKMPERVALDRYHLANATQELADHLGRDPSDAELADRTGFSMGRIRQVRRAHPGVAEGTLEAAGGGQEVFGGVAPRPSSRSAWYQLVYDELHPHDQRIVDMHLAGQSNQAIAAKLGVTPGAISQRKAKIQSLLDQEDELSPFGG